MNERVQGHRLDIKRIARLHGARNVRVFGSALGDGEQGTRDIDLLVEMEPSRSVFDLIDLCDALEELLGVEVDVVTDRGVSPYLRDRIVAQAVAL